MASFRTRQSWRTCTGAGPPATARCDSRQIEDENASNSIGVDFMHVPLPDCVYRLAGDLALYPSEESLFGEIHPSDYAPRLLKGIQIPELDTAARVYLPLGVGRHVDHQIAREWGLTQVRDIPDRSALRFYAEFPYSNADRATETALKEFGLPLEPADATLSENDIRAKINAIACYTVADQHVLAEPGCDGDRRAARLCRPRYRRICRALLDGLALTTLPG